MGEVQDDESLDQQFVFRQFDTEAEEPTIDVAEAIADLKGVQPAELDPLYSTIDHVIENLYSDPPSPEAQVQITFTYEGYRITMHQDGTAKFVKVG